MLAALQQGEICIKVHDLSFPKNQNYELFSQKRYVI